MEVGKGVEVEDGVGVNVADGRTTVNVGGDSVGVTDGGIIVNVSVGDGIDVGAGVATGALQLHKRTTKSNSVSIL